ncbi:hypothetical protein [Pollutibacter soli]|uniref:hypothetical protein n=1 Tax=Pollutibacter soli TaxID=3034157 RepID=UPI003013401B
MKKIIVLVTVMITLFGCKNGQKEKVAVEESEAQKDSAAISEMVTEPGFEDSIFSDGSKPAPWDNAGISNPKAMVDFIKVFQGWVTLDQKDSIVSHTRFPAGQIKSKEDFAKKYAEIFTPEYKSAIAKQNTRQIFRNANGAMIAGGKIWLIQDGNQFLVSAINK